jgi:hypothetical protein
MVGPYMTNQAGMTTVTTVLDFTDASLSMDIV